MNAQTQNIRAEAKRLLEAGEVAVVIGYGEGSTAARTTPVFIKDAADVDKLIWSSACANNLSLYVRDAVKAGKVAVVAKSCDAASLVTLIQEKQIDRADIKIIGVPCRGVVDAAALSLHGVDEGSVMDIDVSGDDIVLNTSAGSVSLKPIDALKPPCSSCTKDQPVIYDFLAGDPVQPRQTPGAEMPDDLEARRVYWAEAFEKCVRCYACRQICPSCYCSTCFTDSAVIKWLSKKNWPEENWMYHATRAMHLAGRCVGCGECQRACPVGIPVGQLMKEMNKDVKELFDYQAGLSFEEPAALGTYTDSDEGPEG